MVEREVGPCLDCGGLSEEFAEFKKEDRTFSKVGFLDNEILCDYCLSDIQSYDQEYYGFPEEFVWEDAKEDSEMTEVSKPAPSKEMACANPKCENTLRRQEFIRKNAERNGVPLTTKYWPHLPGAEISPTVVPTENE